MQKSLFLLGFFLATFNSFSQINLPTIRSNIGNLDIRVGDTYFLKGGWLLEPARNPDIYPIPSKWPYSSKKVTFTSDIDSVSFDVKAGQKYDFIVLYKDTACHIQISASADPVFLNKPILIPLLLGIFLFVLLLFLFSYKMATSTLLPFGYLTVAGFWLMTIVSSIVHENYDHLRNVVSELGAIGSESETITSCLLIGISILHIFFSIGCYRASRKLKLSVLPSILSFAMPLSFIWAAIFTLGNELHSATGPLPLLVIVGSLLSFILWRRGPRFSAIRNVSLLGCLVMLLIMLRFTEPFGQDYPGLVQRFFYLGWSAWTIGTAYFFKKLLSSNK